MNNRIEIEIRECTKSCGNSTRHCFEIFYYVRRFFGLFKIKKSIPFLFDDLESAKDFCKYIPKMKLYRHTLVNDTGEGYKNSIYDTYCVEVDNYKMYVKFYKYSERRHDGDNDIWFNYMESKSKPQFLESFFSEYEFEGNKDPDSTLIPKNGKKTITESLQNSDNYKVYRYVLEEDAA